MKSKKSFFLILLMTDMFVFAFFAEPIFAATTYLTQTTVSLKMDGNVYKTNQPNVTVVQKCLGKSGCPDSGQYSYSLTLKTKPSATNNYAEYEKVIDRTGATKLSASGWTLWVSSPTTEFYKTVAIDLGKPTVSVSMDAKYNFKSDTNSVDNTKQSGYTPQTIDQSVTKNGVQFRLFDLTCSLDNALDCWVKRVFNFSQVAILLLSTAVVIVAGIIYMTSAGSPKQVELAKKLIMGALSGVAVMVLGRFFLTAVVGIAL